MSLNILAYQSMRRGLNPTTPFSGCPYIPADDGYKVLIRTKTLWWQTNLDYTSIH